MYSKMELKGVKSRCTFCGMVFYEYEGHELISCPHCHRDLLVVSSCVEEGKFTLEVYLDNRTGKVYINKA